MYRQRRYLRTETELSLQPKVQAASISSPALIKPGLATSLASQRPSITTPPVSLSHFHTATTASFSTGTEMVRRYIKHPIHSYGCLWEGAGLRRRKQIEILGYFQLSISLRWPVSPPEGIAKLRSSLYPTWAESVDGVEEIDINRKKRWDM